MIELLDAHLLTRLQAIKYGDDPVTVYDYEPQRSHGETIYPCIAFFHTDVSIKLDRQRIDHYIYTASGVGDPIDPPSKYGGRNANGAGGILTDPSSDPDRPGV